MTITLFFFVIFLQIITIYLDNKTNMYDFFLKVKEGNVATAYTKRGITLTVSRTLFYAVPPLLGYLILNTSVTEIERLIIFVAALNLTITIFQSFSYYTKFDKNLINDFLKLKNLFLSLNFFIGIAAFMLFLITPYLLNYFALIYPAEGLWIVQLNAIVNAFLTLYVIWVFEPRIAKKIDKNAIYDNEFFEAIAVRLTGRFLILLLVIIYLNFLS